MWKAASPTIDTVGPSPARGLLLDRQPAATPRSRVGLGELAQREGAADAPPQLRRDDVELHAEALGLRVVARGPLEAPVALLPLPPGALEVDAHAGSTAAEQQWPCGQGSETSASIDSPMR